MSTRFQFFTTIELKI